MPTSNFPCILLRLVLLLQWIPHFQIGKFCSLPAAKKSAFVQKKITTRAYRISPFEIKQPVNRFFFLLLPSHRSPLSPGRKLGRTISRRVESRISGVAPLRGSDSRQRIKRWKFVYKRGANPEFSPPVLKEIPPRFKAGNCRPHSLTICIYTHTRARTHAPVYTYSRQWSV